MAYKRMFIGLIIALICVSSNVYSADKIYTTNFSITENPISEGGKWVSGATASNNNGVPWADIKNSGGIAISTQNRLPDGIPLYDDAIGNLSGLNFGPDHTIQATVYAANRTGSGRSGYGGNEYGDCNREVELHLRSSITPDSGASVYEVLFSSRIDGTAYAGVNRWDHQWTGKADLTFVSGPQYVLSSGDVVKASIVGNPPTIKAYINDVLIFTATDYSPLALKTGNPGMGFYSSSGCSGTAHNGDFGFTSLTAIAQENTATATETRLPNSPSILSIR